jgi:uncharacterized membrane protein YoaK (UPF0700 family)
MKQILSIYQKHKLKFFVGCIFVALATTEYTSASMLACISLIELAISIKDKTTNHTGQSDE